jgi:nucleoside permease NupC
MTRFIPILGMLVILAAATLLSKNRKAIPWRTVGIGWVYKSSWRYSCCAQV